jgi:hypothetical protein
MAVVPSADSARVATPVPLGGVLSPVLGLFVITLFASATLLFLVQPMVAKMILPLFGGTPAVWNTCMVFFQATLLAGYLYAHALTRLALARQAMVHGAMVLLGLLVLPMTIDADRLAAGGHPILQLLVLLLASVGLPFFVVSTSAPLLQQWFAATHHPAATDPYFLYAASNTGSMLALIGYPLLLEPFMPLLRQSQVWTGGYLLLIVLTLGCATAASRSLGPATRTHADAALGFDVPHLRTIDRLRWTALACVPSSLMLGVTTYMTTDIAAIPLLWVMPLGLYLLSFILAFARLPGIIHSALIRVAPIPILLLIFVMISGVTPPFWRFWMTILLHVSVLFIIALVCHGELSRTRPSPQHLTDFYLWVAIGGLIGGLFNGLLAPALFDRVGEYPIALAIACLALPCGHSTLGTRRARLLDLAVPVGLGLLAMVLLSQSVVFALSPERFMATLGVKAGDATRTIGAFLRFDLERLNVFLTFGVPVGLCYFASARRVRFALCVGAVLFAHALVAQRGGEVLHGERSFFGVMEVVRKENHHYLFHGTTLHGVQARDPVSRREPLSYFHRSSPIGEVLHTFKGSRLLDDVAVLGLGTGTLASYTGAGQKLTYYEIDPAAVRIASDPRLFTYLSDAVDRGVALKMVVGDARLKIAEAADGQYGLIVMDAFSSDAVPVHLITREAIAVYLVKLADGGILAVQISNRYLDLAPVLGNVARAVGLTGLVRADMGDDARGKAASHWVLLARHPRDLGDLARDGRWEPLVGQPSLGVWTDDFSNVAGVFRWTSR